MSVKTWGWLGTGRMGTQMASRLLRQEKSLRVWNRTSSKTQSLLDAGATPAHEIRDLSDLDAVFICVTKSEDLLQVTLGEGGLLAGAAVPRFVIDSSTVSAATSAEVRAAAEQRGVQFLAAPISGNPDMVREGVAALVVYGPKDAFDAVHAGLTAIAPTVVYSGVGEEARLVKICHNLLLGVITQALSEVATLAEKGGVNNGAFFDFICGSVLGSSFITHKGRAITERDYEPTFTSVNLRKDFDIGMSEARTLEVPMLLTASTYQLIQTAIGRGYGQHDYVSLYEVQAAGAGLETGAAPL